MLSPKDPQNVEAGGSFWNVEPRKTGFQSICKDLCRVTKLFVEIDIRGTSSSTNPVQTVPEASMMPGKSLPL